MLTIINNLILENRAAYQAKRTSIEEKARILNQGWATYKQDRDSFDICLDPTWGKDDRPHAPFDGYLWANELGEVQAYGGGQYLPYVNEIEKFDKPEYTGDHGWWKLRLTLEMLNDIKAYGDPLQVKSVLKEWDLETTKAMVVEVRAHKTILKAIQEYSENWFNTYYETLKKSKGDAPEGKLIVKGKVVSVKTYEDFYGMISKMTVVMENGSTSYGTLPKSVPLDFRGDISFQAIFTQAKNDNTHSFFKNPCKVEI